MRVIAGKARRIQLKTIEGNNTRPTTDRIKETLFNILQPEIYDATFLDLFSGSGGIGIEALSRGAEHAVFIENNSEAIKCIKDNLAVTKLINQAEVMKADACAGIRQLKGRTPFSIIFMDPPYYKNMFSDALLSVDENELLKEDGIIVVEHDTVDKFPDNMGRLYKSREKKYGNTTITFYKLEE